MRSLNAKRRSALLAVEIVLFACGVVLRLAGKDRRTTDGLEEDEDADTTRAQNPFDDLLEAKDIKTADLDQRKDQILQGVWFGTGEFGSTAKMNSDFGALPYDSYVIEEMACEANEGYIINMLYTNGEIQPEYLPSESDEEEPDEIIDDDDDIPDDDDDDEPTGGGGDSGGSEGTGEEGSDDEENLEKDWGVLKGLKEGVQYRLKETKAPEGYDCDFEQVFTFQDQLEIEAEDVISNHDFIVQKNVTGDLGDLTKEFEYDTVFTNLKPNKTYEYSYIS